MCVCVCVCVCTRVSTERRDGVSFPLSISTAVFAHIQFLCMQVKGKPASRQLDWADLASFPYFNAALKESMRLHPVASTGTFR